MGRKCLDSPDLAPFAGSGASENRGVGSSILPLTTAEFGLLDPSGSPFRVSGSIRKTVFEGPLSKSVQVAAALASESEPQTPELRSSSTPSTQLRIAMSSTASRPRQCALQPLGWAARLPEPVKHTAQTLLRS